MEYIKILVDIYNFERKRENIQTNILIRVDLAPKRYVSGERNPVSLIGNPREARKKFCHKKGAQSSFMHNCRKNRVRIAHCSELSLFR